MMNQISTYVAAHRKFLIVALGAVLVFVADAELADRLIVTADALLVLFVPNDQAAAAAIYGPRRR